MNRIKQAATKTTKKEWVPPWTTGEQGVHWPKGKVLTPRPCTIEELGERADKFRAMGYVKSAAIIEAEIIRRGELE